MLLETRSENIAESEHSTDLPFASDHLKEKTHEAHQAMHRQVLMKRLMSKGVDEFDLHICLKGFSTFYDVLEKNLVSARYRRGDSSYALPYIKAHQIWIEQDLDAFESRRDAPILRELDNTAMFQGPIDYLGVLYVTEGSLLGGSHIAKHLNQSLNKQVAEQINEPDARGTATYSLCCFTGYGDLINRRHFQALKERMNNNIKSSEDLRCLHETAVNTFSLLKLIFDSLASSLLKLS